MDASQEQCCEDDNIRPWEDMKDVMGIIVNSCGLAGQGIAAVRLTCTAWRSSCDGVLAALSPSYPDEYVLDAVMARWSRVTDLSLDRLPYNWVCNPALSRGDGLALLTWLSNLQRLVVTCGGAAALCRARNTAIQNCEPSELKRHQSGLVGLDSLALHGPMKHLRPAGRLISSFVTNLVPLSQLQSLDLVHMHLDGGWPTDGSGPLHQLRSLRLRDCNLCHSLYNSSPWPAGVNRDNVKLLNEQLRRLVGLTQLQLSNCQLAELPSSISCLTTLRSLDVSRNQLRALDVHLSALTVLELFDASHNYLSGAPNLAALVAGWPQLAELRLRNVSDKNGALMLPHKLPASLRTVLLGNNHALDMAAAFAVLAGCPGLRRLEMAGSCAVGKAPDPYAVVMLSPALQRGGVHGVPYGYKAS